MPVPPSSVADWRSFLQSFCATFLASQFMRTVELDGDADEYVTAEQRESGWLGSPPATEELIAATEQRLQLRLPESVRNFYLVSNGWKFVCYSSDMLPLEEIAWFADREAELLNWWSDLDHFTEQLAMLRKCLTIGSAEDSTDFLLLLPGNDPHDAWSAFQWVPGDGQDPERYDDFPTMVADLQDSLCSP